MGHWSQEIVDAGSVEHARLHTKGQSIIGLAAGNALKIQNRSREVI